MSEIDCLVDNDQDLEYQKGKANKDKTKNLASSVGYDESVGDVAGALFGSSNVGVDGNSHSDVAWEDRSETSNQEGNSCIEGAELGLDSQGKQDCEQWQEDCKIDIFLLKESDGSLYETNLVLIGKSCLHQRSAWKYASFRGVSRDRICGELLPLRLQVPLFQVHHSFPGAYDHPYQLHGPKITVGVRIKVSEDEWAWSNYK